MISAAMIRVNEEYAKLVPKQSEEEYESLKQSIEENGLYEPITINTEGEILDGHHRFRACQDLKIEPKTEVKDFKDKLDEKIYVIDRNLTRRHLNNFQKAELALLMKPIQEEIAKRNMSLGGKGGEIKTPLGRVNDQIGQRVGIGKDTIRKVEKILKYAPETIKEKTRIGEMSVNEAYEEYGRGEIEVINEEGNYCFANVPIGLIELHEWLDREEHDRQFIHKLAVSIMEVDIVNPIILRSVKGTNKYEVIDGNARVKAFKTIKQKYIPSIIMKDLAGDNAKSMLVSFTLHAHNKPLTENEIRRAEERIRRYEKGRG
jgi:ParB-like chromosome segregation protein Spo0J